MSKEELFKKYQEIVLKTNGGAYYLMSHLEVIPENQRNEVLVITNYHMNVYDWKTEKTHNKYKNLLGDWYYSLIKFHEADEGAY